MAYADTNSTNRKLGATAAVVVLEAGLAWAIIAGLTMTITHKDQTRTTTFTVPPDTKVTPPEPQPQPSAQPQQRAPRPQVDRIYDLGPAALPTFVADDSLGSGGDVAIEIPRATPTPPPVPSFTPRSARPKGNYAGWVTTNDYPTAGLRAEHEGSVRYRLSIDSSGKVGSCSVLASSGHADLDAATCATLTRRARFEPATNDSGTRTGGTYIGTVTWRLPQD